MLPIGDLSFSGGSFFGGYGAPSPMDPALKKVSAQIKAIDAQIKAAKAAKATSAVASLTKVRHQLVARKSQLIQNRQKWKSAGGAWPGEQKWKPAGGAWPGEQKWPSQKWKAPQGKGNKPPPLPEPEVVEALPPELAPTPSRLPWILGGIALALVAAGGAFFVGKGRAPSPQPRTAFAT